MLLLVLVVATSYLALEMIKERTSKNVLNSNHLITSVSRTIKDKIESTFILKVFKESSKDAGSKHTDSTLGLIRLLCSS